MSENNKPSIAYIVSLCGIMCGLALALMFFLSMIPAFEYISPAAAGILIWVIRERLGVKYGVLSYAAVGILILIFSPNYEAGMMYIFLLGYYPIAREFIMKIKFAAVRGIAKLALYAAASVSCYLLLIYIMGMKQLLDDMGEFGEYGSFILLGMGAAAFCAYDFFLSLFKPFYEKIIKPKVRKRMK